MKSILLIALLFSFAANAANPAIIFGSGGYAENLAPSGIKLKSGNSIDDTSSTLLSTGGDIRIFQGTSQEMKVGDELLQTLSTGVTAPNGMSINGGDNTKYDVAVTTGHIVDRVLNTYVSVSYAGSTGNTPDTANGVTYIFIDKLEALTSQLTTPTSEDLREKIYLGRVITIGGVVVQTQSEPVVIENTASSIYDLAKALRIFSVDGNIFSANGANLNINKSEGELFSIGSNYDTTRNDPHKVTFSSCVTCTFAYVTQLSGSTGANTTLIDPANYDSSGTITAIGGGLKQSTIQRIYGFPSGAIRVQYGQTVYADISTALQNLNAEVHIVNPNIPSNGVLLALIIARRDATDLSDSSQARILISSRFGDGAVSAAGQSVSSLQNAYDNSTDGEIIVDAVDGSVEIRDASTPIAAPLFEVVSNDSLINYFKVAADQVTSTSLDINGRLNVISTLFPSKPCPVVTTIERNDMTPVQGDCVYNSTDLNLNYYDGITWDTIGLPDQTGNAGLALTTNGTNASWEVAERLNDQLKDNLIVNPSYERGLIGADDNGDLVIVHAGGFDVSGRDPRTLQGSTHNFFALNIESIVAGNSFELTKTTTKDFTGRQMVAYCEIRTSRDDVYFQAYGNSVDLVTELKVNNDDKWRYYKIPFSGGNTPSMKVTSKGNVLLDATKVDNCFLGVSDNETIDIGAAHFVGSLTYENPNCLWNSTSTTWSSFPIDPDCIASNIVGNVAAPDTQIPAIKVLNPRLDGEYKVETLCISSGNTDSYFSLSSDGLKDSNNGTIYTSSSNIFGVSPKANFRFSSTSDKTIEILTRQSSGTGSIYGRGDNEVCSFSVHFFPDSKNTIVSQDTELTAKTANLFSANISSSGVVSRENFDWLNGNCTNAATSACTFNSNIFTEIPRCWIEAVRNDISCTPAAVGISTGIINHTCYNSAGSLLTTTTDRQLFCEKVGADVNKSQTIVGSFEQIRSDDLTSIRAELSLGGAITQNVTPLNYIETSDDKSEWSGDTFTPASSGTFKFEGVAYFTTAESRDIYLWINRQGAGYVQEIYASKSLTANTTIYPYSGTVDLLVGDTVQIRQGGGASTTQRTTLKQFNYLTITQSATKESIVANLMQGQTTKCQTKYLSADSSSIGTLADLAFAGLTVGKKYDLRGQFFGNGDSQVQVRHNGTTVIARWYSETAAVAPINSGVFTATTTTIEPHQASTLTIFGNNGKDESWLELCELPDTVIETDEW